MISKVECVSRADASRLISQALGNKLNANERLAWQQCLRTSSTIWVGTIDGVLVCIFGLISPTLSDDRAYLWLHTTDAVQGHEFTFVRSSQIGIKKLLETWPIICGHCEISAKRSQRWVKWLGAKFGQPEGTLVPFQIVRQDG